MEIEEICAWESEAPYGVWVVQRIKAERGVHAYVPWHRIVIFLEIGAKKHFSDEK